MNGVQGDPLEFQFVALVSLKPHPALNLLGPRLWLVWGTKIQHPSWTPVGEAAGGVLYENAEALPRAWLVDHAVVMETRDERLKSMVQGPFNPAKTGILHQIPREAETAYASSGLTTSPWTSVRRKSRPWKRYVSFV